MGEKNNVLKIFAPTLTHFSLCKKNKINTILQQYLVVAQALDFTLMRRISMLNLFGKQVDRT